MNKNSYRSIIVVVFLLLITPVVVLGQNTEELCRAFVNQAFRDLGNNCANLGSGEACYAYGDFGEVSTTFYVDGEAQVVREENFAEPSERVSIVDEAELSTVESLTTEEFFLDRNNNDEDDNRWGVAMLEVPANLPRQLDKNTAVYVLFGGARVENAVYPEDAFMLPEEAVTVAVNDGSSLFGSPEGQGYLVPDDVVGTASGDLEADAVSPDGNWARVFFRYDRSFGERATAWVRTEDLSSTDGLDSLPVMGPETNSAMQSFFLTNNFTTPLCDDVPAPGLLVQGPEEIETDFSINNMPVRVTSTAYFRQISARRLEVVALTGFTILFPDTDNEEIIPEGFARTICLSEELDLGIDGQVNDREIDPNCPESGIHLSLGFGGFGNIPSNLLNYGVSLPIRVCPSGVGNVQCSVVPASPARIQDKCESGQLPEAVCDIFGF